MANTYRDNFTENFKYYLSKSGKSQQQLADEMNVNKSVVSSWVNGKIPRADRIDALAKCLNIDAAQFAEDRTAAPIAIDARIKLIAREISESEELMKIFLEMKDKSPEEIKKATDVLKAMYGK